MEVWVYVAVAIAAVAVVLAAAVLWRRPSAAKVDEPELGLPPNPAQPPPNPAQPPPNPAQQKPPIPRPPPPQKPPTQPSPLLPPPTPPPTPPAPKQQKLQPPGMMISTFSGAVPATGWTLDTHWRANALAKLTSGYILVFEKDAKGVVKYYGRSLATVPYTGIIRRAENMASTGSSGPDGVASDLGVYALAASSIAASYPFSPARKARIQRIADDLLKAADAAAKKSALTWLGVGPKDLATQWAYPTMATFSPQQKLALYAVQQRPDVPARTSVKVEALTVLHPAVQAYFADRGRSEKGFPTYVCAKGWGGKWYLLRESEQNKPRAMFRLESHQRKIETILEALLKVFGPGDVRYTRLLQTVAARVAPDVALAVQMENDGAEGGNRIGGYVTANPYREIAPSGVKYLPSPDLGDRNLGFVFMNVSNAARDGALGLESNIIEGQFVNFVHEVTHISAAAVHHDEDFFNGWRVMCHLSYLCGAWTGPASFAYCSDNPKTYGDWMPFFDKDWWNCTVPRLKKWGDKIP